MSHKPETCEDCGELTDALCVDCKRPFCVDCYEVCGGCGEAICAECLDYHWCREEIAP